jgi:preprotein translocase subunit SecF
MGQIAYQVYTTGDFINRGVSLKGGITVNIPNVDYDPLKLEAYLQKELKEGDISVRTLSSASQNIGLVIDAGITDKDKIDNTLEMIRNELEITKDDYSVEIIGSALGGSFFRETFTAIIIAFIFMGIVVWLFFRVPAPTGYVILCAASDIIETVAIVNLIGIKISTAGIAAYLMLVGYSVDTDMLLTARVLRRKEGSIMDGVYSAIKTGVMMNLTTMTALVVGFFFAQSSALKEIMIILLIGLVLDNMNTWIQNAGLLRLYLEKKPEMGKIKEN